MCSMLAIFSFILFDQWGNEFLSVYIPVPNIRGLYVIALKWCLKQHKKRVTVIKADVLHYLALSSLHQWIHKV